MCNARLILGLYFVSSLNEWRKFIVSNNIVNLGRINKLKKDKVISPFFYSLREMKINIPLCTALIGVLAVCILIDDVAGNTRER